MPQNIPSNYYNIIERDWTSLENQLFHHLPNDILFEHILPKLPIWTIYKFIAVYDSHPTLGPRLLSWLFKVDGNCT